jgi:hypothetical protein
MDGKKACWYVAVLAVCVLMMAPGCGRKTRACVHATVNTQRASLNNITRGHRGHFGGLTARINIVSADQKALSSRLDKATDSAKSLRSEADQLANAQENAIRDEAKQTAADGSEDSVEKSPSE